MIAPEANPHLYGHERVEGVLLRALASGRLPHAWLLRGPHGVGKATLAYRFARRLLAGGEHDRAATNPNHPIFRMVMNKAHPDLRVLERIANPKTGRLYREILVEQVRAVDETLHATAARDGYKVLIVDAADELNPSGANALLKLFEEPPPRTVMLLVCQRSGVLPRTVLSRCMQLPLAPLSRDDLTAGLGQLAPDVPADRRATLAALAEGSVGRALELEASGRLARYTDLLPKLANSRHSIVARLDLAGELAKAGDGRGFRGQADLLCLAVRRLAFHGAGLTAEPELFAGEHAHLDAIAAGLGLDQWVAVWDKLSALSGQVDRLGLDPVQALLQVVQAINGVAPEPELSPA